MLKLPRAQSPAAAATGPVRRKFARSAAALAPRGLGRQIARVVAGSAAVVTLAAGLTMVVADPAAALTVENGTWRAVGSQDPANSWGGTHKCDAGWSDIGASVQARKCGIRSANGQSVQGAIVIRNSRPTLVGVQVAFMMDTLHSGTFDIRWVCPDSGVGANSYSVCFGRTFQYTADKVGIHEAGANGVPLYLSEWTV
ncbi:hypothetical protein [Cryptosporangium phraense]|uniref:Uncharacterized protein n=1 Tax=Cryptosporangium phraense TaxID=2593070 RepID=A0A545AQU8_9ACTN|nr:hypothetical protein [Cryptosporangium phraense]TQS43694.1 hypothetical protein FL583_18885 [Cryptosporangium phraense]